MRVLAEGGADMAENSEAIPEKFREHTGRGRIHQLGREAADERRDFLRRDRVQEVCSFGIQVRGHGFHLSRSEQVGHTLPSIAGFALVKQRGCGALMQLSDLSLFKPAHEEIPHEILGHYASSDSPIEEVTRLEIRDRRFGDTGSRCEDSRRYSSLKHCGHAQNRSFRRRQSMPEFALEIAVEIRREFAPSMGSYAEQEGMPPRDHRQADQVSFCPREPVCAEQGRGAHTI